MGEDAATLAEEAPPDHSDDGWLDDDWLDDDGRDHGAEPGPAIASAVWWAVSAGVMLLLPRQWGAAGIAFGIAAILWLVKRRRHPPAKKPEARGQTKDGRETNEQPEAKADPP